MQEEDIKKNEEIVKNINSGYELTLEEKRKISDSIENDILALLHGTRITINVIEEFDHDNYICDIIHILSPIKEEIEKMGLKDGVRVKLGKNVDFEQKNEDGTITIIF